MAKEGTKLGQLKGVQYNIHLNSNVPVYTKPIQLIAAEEQALNREIEEMLKMGVIEEANSPYSSNVVMVPKPNGSIRVCINYWKLNQITNLDKFPIPVINRLLAFFYGMKYFSHKYYTAFNTPTGQYQFIIMPFGLCNSPATFQ